MKTIYALFDVLTGDVKYVGQTKLGIRRRLALWRSNSKKHPTRPVCAWILDLGRMRVGIKWLEEVSDSKADEQEQYWIARTPGLLNISIGGPGTTGMTQTASTKERRSKAITAQWRAGVGAATRDPFFHTPEMRRKQSEARKAWWERRRAVS
jgi:hypothetical protein